MSEKHKVVVPLTPEEFRLLSVLCRLDTRRKSGCFRWLLQREVEKRYAENTAAFLEACEKTPVT